MKVKNFIIVLTMALPILTGCFGDSNDEQVVRDIVFVTNSETAAINYDIYAMKADGSGVIRLTDNPASDMQPAWSPDKSKIAFASDRDNIFDIYVMNADGSDQTRITDNAAVDSSPSWSSDGLKIVFVSERDGDAEIFVMNADGSDQTQLTANSVNDARPSFSPDGTKIVYSGRNAGGYLNIFVMDADGDNVTNLTNADINDGGPLWSPDGTKIYFSGTHGLGRINEYFSMNTDGTDVLRITSDNDVSKGDMAISPDGTQFVYAYSGEIWGMDVDGTNRRLILDVDGRYFHWQ
ncbi:MAG: hypothetical protein CVV44_23380 [Spirochaetae bacterium HGW-Spirochaetae-1]|jgi:Tol biopolymer transport system component|nr:MAG: hypothetical protein CVV44_23380 [Spirochaetae bacterium HGW-Spirochaetae-1]